MDGLNQETEKDILLALISACRTITVYSVLYQNLDEYLTLRESMDPLTLRVAKRFITALKRYRITSGYAEVNGPGLPVFELIW
jgi:hypothetical protein